uniref:Uncharacterized protein n=1 Tax=Steinernema glaseri TaxID=37863 RepID=A0A1I7YQV8_9BILA
MAGAHKVTFLPIAVIGRALQCNVAKDRYSIGSSWERISGDIVSDSSLSIHPIGLKGIPEGFGRAVPRAEGSNLLSSVLCTIRFPDSLRTEIKLNHQIPTFLTHHDYRHLPRFLKP